MGKYYDEHYNKVAEQPIEKMQRGYKGMTREMFLGFLLGNIIKYEDRIGLKDGEPTEKEMVKIQRYSDWYERASRGEYINPRE